MKDLHKDPWMMARISTALDSIRYADETDLETELDLLAFAEDVLDHYRGAQVPQMVDERDQMNLDSARRLEELRRQRGEI